MPRFGLRPDLTDGAIADAALESLADGVTERLEFLVPLLIAAHESADSHACWLLAYPLAGWLGSTFGLAPACAVLAAVAVVSTVIGARLWPQPDPVALVHEHEEMEHRHLHVHDEHHQHEHEGWEGPEPHSHPHHHPRMRHVHAFVIDRHHPHWPRG